MTGTLRLSQASEESATIIEGEIRGLTEGKHGISVNVYGNLSGGAAGCGPIFNPFGEKNISIVFICVFIYERHDCICYLHL